MMTDFSNNKTFILKYQKSVRAVALHGHVVINFATIISLYRFIFIKFGIIA